MVRPKKDTHIALAVIQKGDSVILVLDDYHTIESSQVDDALLFLLENAPPQLHLVIATRADLAFPLARLRAQGQMTELRATDLRFSLPEADLRPATHPVLSITQRRTVWKCRGSVYAPASSKPRTVW